MDSLVSGRKNIIFGWISIFIWVLFGIFLEMKLSDPQWGVGPTRILRKLLKDAHAHAIGLSFLNILYGLMIDRITFDPGIRNQGSWLALTGGALFPVSMLATILNENLFYGTYMAGFFILIAIWIMFIGMVRKSPGSPLPDTSNE